MSRFMITFLASCWCIGTPRIMAQTAPTDSAQLLAVAANGYRANLESFEYMTCKYTVTWGFSKTLDDALAGRMEPGSQMAKAVFYKNGRIIRFRIEEDAASKATLDKPLNPEKMAEFPGLKTGPFVPFKTTDYLLNESHGLLFDPRGRTANIYDADTEKWKTV